MIKIIGLKAGYEKNKAIINDLSFSVGSGENVSIVGRNGTGKSTLAKAIMGQIPFLEGNIFVNGINITKMSLCEKQKAGIGYLMQTNSTFPNLTIDENFKLAHSRSRAVIAKSENKSIDNVLETIFPIKTRNRHANQLSGGERRILSLLMVIVSNPNLRVLIIDELNAGVDHQNKKKLASLLDKLQTKIGFSILSIEHDEVKLSSQTKKVIKL